MQTQNPRAYKITPVVRREIVQIIDERIKEAHVTKEDFSELKAIVWIVEEFWLCLRERGIQEITQGIERELWQYPNGLGAAGRGGL